MSNPAPKKRMSKSLYAPPWFAAALAEGQTKHAIHNRTGISEITLRKWEQLPSVQEDIKKIQAAIRDAYIARTHSAATRASDVVDAVLAVPPGKDACPHCGRGDISTRDQLEAVKIITKTLGMDQSKQTNVSIVLPTQSKGEDADILKAAIFILEGMGETDIAASIRSVAR